MNNGEFEQKKSLLRRRLTILGVILAIVILLIFLIINSNSVNAWVHSVLSLFRPILAGLILAYLLLPVFRFFERRVFRNLHPLGLRRTLALICAYLFLLLIFVLLFLLIVPQLVSGIQTFLGNYQDYLQNSVARYNGFVEWLNASLQKWNLTQNFLQSVTVKEVNSYLNNLITDVNNFSKLLEQVIPSATPGNMLSAIVGTVTGITHAIFAFFISLYLLATKERLYAQTMKLRRALFSDRVNARITRVCTVADRSFGSFLEGKLFDSLIIGILTYLILLIFRIPYPVLVAAIVGVTNIVPIIGPIFGAIPSALIVAFEEPSKILPVLLIILVIQQIDGNIIGPKILGSSNGVSSLCVLVAVMIMGKLWGLWGMLIGVPLFATVLDLLDTFSKDRLRAKGLPTTTENYYPPDSPLDPAADMKSGSERSLRKWESGVLRLQNLQADGKKLSVREKLSIWFYKKGRKFSILPKISAEALAQFAAEEAIRRESDAIEKRELEAETVNETPIETEETEAPRSETEN